MFKRGLDYVGALEEFKAWQSTDLFKDEHLEAAVAALEEAVRVEEKRKIIKGFLNNSTPPTAVEEER